jgi:hypothetical protein
MGTVSREIGADRDADAVETGTGMVATIYGARTVKHHRRTNEQLGTIDDAIGDLLATWWPMTVRQVYYRLVSFGLVPKDESGYRLVQRECLKLRRSGTVPYGAIADSTRWMRKPRTHRGAQAAISDAVRSYRRSLWETQDVLVEVWVEKDALAGVLLEVTDPFDVPLLVSRGFSSESYLYEAATWIRAQGKPAHIVVLTDYDAAGLGIARDVARKLPAFLPAGWPVEVERLAVTEAQIAGFGLATRAPKPRDVAAGMSRCVELDAIDPPRLNALLEAAVTAHLDADQWERTKRIEERERQTLEAVASWLPTILEAEDRIQEG